MKKRIVIIGLLLAVAVGVGAVVYWALTPTPGVTVENFKRLHRGMKLQQVETILSTNWTTPVPELTSFGIPAPGPKKWQGKNCDIELHFWGAQLVKGTCSKSDGQLLNVAKVPLTLFERIRTWFGYPPEKRLIDQF